MTSCGPAAVVTPAPSPTPTVAPASAQALQAVSSASRRTLSATAAVSLDLVAAKVLGASTAPVLGSGVFDFAAGRGRAVLSQPGGSETVVFEPSSVFVRQPTAVNVLPRGKTWISADLNEAEKLNTNFPQFVVQAEGVNPGFLLDQVAFGAVSAAPLARRVVDGSPASGYLVGVDLSRAGTTGGHGPASAAYGRAIGYEVAALDGGGPTSSPPIQEFRVWIDGSLHVVLLQASPPGSGVGVTTVSFSSFGAPVQIRVPPRSQTANVASLTPGGERENNGGGDADGA